MFNRVMVFLATVAIAFPFSLLAEGAGNGGNSYEILYSEEACEELRKKEKQSRLKAIKYRVNAFLDTKFPLSEANPVKHQSHARKIRGVIEKFCKKIGYGK